MLGASPHCERPTPKRSSILLDGNSTQNQQRVPRFQRVSQEASTTPQHSDESRQMNQCPPRDAICHIKSNIHVKQNFILWMLIDPDK